MKPIQRTMKVRVEYVLDCCENHITIQQTSLVLKTFFLPSILGKNMTQT